MSEAKNTIDPLLSIEERCESEVQISNEEISDPFLEKELDIHAEDEESDKAQIKPERNINSYSKKRRLARVMAVQTIYTLMLNPSDVQDINQAIFNTFRIHDKKRIKHHISDEAYLINLIKGCHKNMSQLDIEIGKYLAKDWRLERIGKVVQSILRLAAFEIIHSTDVDRAIAINEYIEIAKYFNHDGEAGFINSVLDKIAKNTL